MQKVKIKCHCRQTDAIIECDNSSKAPYPTIELCHCYGCRHSTGQLYSSYYTIGNQNTHIQSIIETLSEYRSAVTCHTVYSESPTIPTSLFFCKTCGCHVFRRLAYNDNDTVIQVASGTIYNDREDLKAVRFGPHSNIASTIDGGGSIWLNHIESQPASDDRSHFDSELARLPTTTSTTSFVDASCLCSRVTFRITHPTEQSRTPSSGFSDMIIPFYTKDSNISNPNDVKWWLCQNGTKYMAGLCACRSCRLISGFELQAWAFVPRVNLEFRLGANSSWAALDFTELNGQQITQRYESSPGVIREFCSGCGATIFWHDKWRPDLIDVSVGLLCSHDGVRAEHLLDWCLTRISFVEDAALDRQGSTGEAAQSFVSQVERNMKELALETHYSSHQLCNSTITVTKPE